MSSGRQISHQSELSEQGEVWRGVQELHQCGGLGGNV